jgi:hypothetical protein
MGWQRDQCAVDADMLALRQPGNPAAGAQFDKVQCTALPPGDGWLASAGRSDAMLGGAARKVSDWHVGTDAVPNTYLMPRRACSETLSVSRSFAPRDQTASSPANPMAGSRVETLEPAAMAGRQCQRGESTRSAGIVCFGDHIDHRAAGLERNPLQGAGVYSLQVWSPKPTHAF